MELVRAYSDYGSHSVIATAGKPSGSIYQNGSGIDRSNKLLCQFHILRYNAVGVAGAVLVYVLNSFVDSR